MKFLVLFALVGGLFASNCYAGPILGCEWYKNQGYEASYFEFHQDNSIENLQYSYHAHRYQGTCNGKEVLGKGPAQLNIDINNSTLAKPIYDALNAKENEFELGSYRKGIEFVDATEPSDKYYFFCNKNDAHQGQFSCHIRLPGVPRFLTTLPQILSIQFRLQDAKLFAPLLSGMNNRATFKFADGSVTLSCSGDLAVPHCQITMSH